MPRTFIGSLLLGSATWIATLPVALAFSIPKFYYQIISTRPPFSLLVSLLTYTLARLLLATLNWVGLVLVRRAVDRRFGARHGPFFTLITFSQFHLPFWMGRTLPNMFALFPGG